MRLDTQPGEMVVFAHPDWGYEHDKKNAKRHLVEGETYEVSDIDISDWETSVCLKGFKGSFNSVHFENVK